MTFYSNNIIDRISSDKTTHIFVDGKHGVGLTQATQALFFIIKNDNNNTLMFATVLHNYKTQEAYQQVISSVIERLGIENVWMHCDFELAMINAIKALNYKITPCYFHFCKIIEGKKALLNRLMKVL